MGLQEIADLLGHPYAYMNVLRKRAGEARQAALDVGQDPDPDLFPEEDYTVSNRPLWRKETIEAWAKRTGRV